MEYTKAQVAFCDSLAFKQARLAARGVWIQLCIHCAKAENGGTIDGAATWTATDWLMACGMKSKDVAVAEADGLVRWVGSDLVVLGYDQTGEDRCRKNRTVGRLGGRPPRHADNPTVNPTVIRSPNQNITQSRPVQTIPVQTSPDAPQTEPTHPADTLGTWVRTGTSDSQRSEENRALLRSIVDRYGTKEVQKIAEKLVFERAAKVWPEDLLVALSAAERARKTAENTPPLPPEVVQALAVCDRIGPAEVKRLIGFTCPDDEVRHWLGLNVEACSELLSCSGESTLEPPRPICGQGAA